MRQLIRSNTFATSAFTSYTIRYHGTDIIQANDFSTIFAEFKAQSKKSIAFFDLDDTLITRSGYGSDRWFSKQEKTLKQSPNYTPEQFMLLLAEYHAIIPHLKQTTTEPCVPEQLMQLKKMGIPIFGLSARSPCISEPTYRHLHELGIKFTEDTIILCDGRSKSACLEAFSKTPLGRHTFFGVKNALFIDDRKSHCEAVKAFFDKANINSLVANYTRVAELHPMASDEEIENEKRQLIQAHGLSLPRF